MLRFTFASSSDFVLPILEDIYNLQGQNLSEIAQTQAKNLPLASLPARFAEVWVQIPSNFWTLPVLNQKYELPFIITQPASILRGKTIPNEVEKWAQKQDIPVFSPVKLSLETEFLKSQHIDLGIVSSFGQILNSKTLATPNFGWINWHPSKLPQYRGPTPMQTTLMNGETQTALSWIEMGKKMDAGNVLLQIDQQVKLTTNIIELAKQMGELGASTWAIATCLHIYHQIYPQYQFSITQDDQNVSICNILKKEDRIVELAQKSAFEVYNHFRAYQNFPGTSFYSKYFKQEIKILEIDLETVQKHAKEYNLEIDQLLNNSGILEQKTTFADFFKQKNQVYLICKDQTLLPIKSVQLLENNQKITLAGYNFKR